MSRTGIKIVIRRIIPMPDGIRILQFDNGQFMRADDGSYILGW